MMTVREAVAFLPAAYRYNLVYDGSHYDFDPDSAFHMAAFGDFDVACVENVNKDATEGLTVEFHIACKPLKNGVPV